MVAFSPTIAVASTFEKVAVFSDWLQTLGNLGDLEGYHLRGQIRFVETPPERLRTSPSENFTRNPLFESPQNLIGTTDSLLKALTFVAQTASLDVEYAIIQGMDGAYQVYEGGEEETRLPDEGRLVLHTHGRNLPLPSMDDLSRIYQEASDDPNTASLIYSRPEGLHHLSFIRPSPERAGDFYVDLWNETPRTQGAEARRFLFHLPASWKDLRPGVYWPDRIYIEERDVLSDGILAIFDFPIAFWFREPGQDVHKRFEVNQWIVERKVPPQFQSDTSPELQKILASLSPMPSHQEGFSLPYLLWESFVSGS